MQEVPPNTPMQLLTSWHRRLTESQFAHDAAARRLGGDNIKLGVPAFVLAAMTGAALFATLERPLDALPRAVFGGLSVAVALLSALQTFLRSAERAERHRVIAARYGAARRHAEQLLVSGALVTTEELAALRAQTDRITEEAPKLGHGVLRALRKEFGYATDSEASVVATS